MPSELPELQSMRFQDGEILGLSVVKNEADIIEAMVRHNLRYVDRLHVVDNGSTDRTQEILSALMDEQIGLSYHVDARPGHIQRPIINVFLRESISSDARPRHVVLLDADEVLIGDPENARNTMRESDSPLDLRWVTYVPSDQDDPSVINPLERISMRRTDEVPQYYKITVPGNLIGLARVGVGSHSLRVNGVGVKSAPSPNLSIAHFPIRTKPQLISKALIGHWNLRLRGSRGREGKHWHQMARQIKANGGLSDQEMFDWARRFVASQDVPLIRDPVYNLVPYDLKYTPTHSDYLLRNMIDFVEVLLGKNGI